MSKPESERPAGCRFWTAKDVMEWIRANVPDTEYTAHEVAIRWKASLDAEGMSDLSFRELIDLCVEGYPGTTLEDVTDELQSPWLDGGDLTGDKETYDMYVEASLRQWFGLSL